MPIFQSYNFTEYKRQAEQLNAVQSFTYNGKTYTATGWGTTRYHGAVAYTIKGINAEGESITVRTSLVH